MVGETSSKKLRGDNFNFRKHCLFCIKVTPCILPNEYDPKISRQRYEPASKVATDKLPTGSKFKTYKVLLEAKCHERKDVLGVVVLARLANAISDLQAAAAASFTL